MTLFGSGRPRVCAVPLTASGKGGQFNPKKSCQANCRKPQVPGGTFGLISTGRRPLKPAGLALGAHVCAKTGEVRLQTNVISRSKRSLIRTSVALLYSLGFLT